jgi:hypothetical protein
MLIEAITIATLLDFAKIISAVSVLGGLIVGVFKMINWVKTQLSSIDANVVTLKESMDANVSGLREDVKAQTHTIATALSEQRQDFRTFFAPSLLMTQQHYMAQASLQQAAVPMKAKRNSARKPAKAKTAK